jgi:signal transduction histidine kinase
LIDDLLDVARIDAGTLRVEPDALDVAVLLDEAYELHKPLAADKGVALFAEFPRELGQAPIDKHRMAQVLSNLLGNALKFTPRGGTIRLGASAGAEGVGIYVTDSGPGIDPENLGRVFDRFWQKEQNPSGVGLGLAIAKGIVEAHGGTISVESQPGAGATFRLCLKRPDAVAGEVEP